MKFKLIVWMFLFWSPFVSNAQMNKRHIIASFDTVIYYPDSSIKEAAHLKKQKLHGYAVRFDTNGNPFEIGRYKNGKIEGTWLMSNGCFSNEDGILGCPGCGTGRTEAKNDFKLKYLELTGIDLRVCREKPDGSFHLD